MNKIFTLLILIFALVSCGDDGLVDRRNDPVLIDAEGKYEGSTPAGNLMATAIKEEMQVDIAFYPSAFINNDHIAYAMPGMNNAEIESVLKMYPDGPADKFLIGNMKGSKIKHFIFDRISEKYTSELQVAGVHYDIRFTGGIPVIANFSRNRRVELQDDKWYKVAISNFFFFSGATFPGYKFRNGMGNYTFKRFNDDLYSARDALRSYLKDVQLFPFIHDVRANVVNNTRNTMFGNDPSTASGFGKDKLNNHKRFVSIPRIQGIQHRSPYYGHKLVTRGIVTAVNNSQWYPWGIDVIIQDPNGDGNPKTSDGLHVHLANEAIELELGDDITVAGTVFEQTMHEGLSKTSIRNVIDVKVNSKENPLPAPVLLGKGGRALPKLRHSTWVGNLNQRPSLNLNDGIDFWESLEGMRVKINNPRILGFRGGKEELGLRDERRYISLFIRPDGDLPTKNDTEVNGAIIDFPNLDWNPQIMQMTTHHLTKGLTNNDNFNVGDLIEGDIEGVLVYEKNMFGGGDYMFVLPEAEPEIKEHRIRRITPFIKRPKFKYPAHDDDHLTIASYNVKNLAGNLRERIRYTGEAIRENLKCPDILTLVEIQDNNGVDFFDGGDASFTAKKVMSAADCLQARNVDYKLVNIDPITHKEGGQPGGNIRVVMIYNGNKVSFKPRRVGENTLFTFIDQNGDLSHNPGRVFPQHRLFQNTRRTLVSQFTFKGKKIFVLGNHLNSKLGDTSLFDAEQPFYSRSEERRVPRAMLLNDYVQLLERQNPGALISVVGDFNAYYNERSMRVLAGQEMVNLIEYKNMIPKNMRYSTNHNGNSQALDYIFVNKEFLKYHPQPEILHINSNFMGRISDHDPFLARFDFSGYGSESGRCGWKFLKDNQNLFKKCDVIGGAKVSDGEAVQCVKDLNRFMANSPSTNCRAEKDMGFTHRSYQIGIDSIVELIQELL
jgi:predicted extracellular nuclease